MAGTRLGPRVTHDPSVSKRLLKSTVLVLLVANVSNFLNYLIQILLGRFLSADSYGAFNSVNSLGTIASFGTQVLAIVMAKYTPIHGVERSHMHEWVGRWRNLVVGVGLLCTFVLCALTGYFAEFLKLRDRMPQILFFVGSFLFHIFVMYNSIINGFGSYLTAASMLAGHTAMRVVFTWYAVKILDMDYSGPFAATVVASVIAMVWQMALVYRRIRRLPQATAESVGKSGKNEFFEKSASGYGFLLPTSISLLIVALWTNVDMVFVKHYVAPAEAGYYSMASMVARIGFFLPHTLSFLILPEISRNALAKRSSMGTIIQLGGTCALIAGSYAAMVSLLPNFFLTLFFGPSGSAGVEFVAPVAWATAVIAVANMMFSIQLGKSQYRYLWGAALGTGLTIAAMAFRYHSSATEIALTLLWGACATLIMSLAMPAVQVLRRREAL